MKYLFVQVRYHINHGMRDEFYRRFRDNNIREFSRSESGNLDYEIYFPLDSDDDICLLEKWKDIESQRQHEQTLHYAILTELKSKFVKRVEIRRFWLEDIEPDTKVSL